MKPRISVIMPAFNAGQTIERALDSLKAQTFREWEVIICNDGSTDNTPGAVAQWALKNGADVKLISQPNKGPAAARNAAIAQASAEYLFNLDADDEISPDFLAEAVEALDNGAYLFTGQTRRIYDGQEIAMLQREWTGYRALLRTCIINVASAYHKDRCLECGGWDETMFSYEDWEFWIRYLEGHDDVEISDTAIFTYHRSSSGLWSTTHQWDYTLRQMIRERNRDIFRRHELYTEPADETLVILPYFAQGAQGRELEFALRGWHRYAQFPFRLVIVGDKPSFDLSRYPHAEWLPCGRVEDKSGQYLPNRDISNKIRTALDAYPQHRGFIYTCDDINPIGDFTLADIQTIKCNKPEMSHEDNYDHPTWYGAEKRTYEALTSRGLPTRSYVCHLPVWLECKKWDALDAEYDLAENDFVFEELYFNTFFPNAKPILLGLDTDNIRIRIESGRYSIPQVCSLMRKKLWLSYGTAGYNKELETLLTKYYEL